MKHIDRAISSSGHSPMYVMHKFFGRKQEDVIREYIKCYTNKGDLILDPFCGSGVMIGEAVKLKRKAIGLDINPMSIFISRNTLLPADITEIEREFYQISAEISHEINSLYETQCRECCMRVEAICYTWNKNNLIDVRYECPTHGKQIHPINFSDQNLYKKIQNGKIPSFFDDNGVCKYWYPQNRFLYNKSSPFLKKERYNSVNELFTIRNLISLAKLYSRIEKIENPDIRSSFKFAFTSMTHLASKMTPVRSSRPFSSAWVQQSYWYCSEYMESNVWLLFERSVKGKQGLLRAKKDLLNQNVTLNESSSIKELLTSNSHGFHLIQNSIDNLDNLEPNSVDYVITDPPYGYSIQYGELLFMWGAWIDTLNEFKEYITKEIVVNPRQNKDEVKYEQMLLSIFKRIHYLLKPFKYCTVTFHNPNLKFRNILVRTVLIAGFSLEKIVYQPPSRPSAKSLLQPFGSLEGDYFFRFKKSTIVDSTTREDIDESHLETLVVEKVIEILIKRGEPTHYTFIQNVLDPLLYEELNRTGQIMRFQPESIEKILKKYEGTVFVLVPLKFRKIGSRNLVWNAWWLKNPNDYKLKTPLSIRVSNAIEELLNTTNQITVKEVQNIVFEKFQDVITPDLNLIMEILTQKQKERMEVKD
ncbi:MAG: hypothetical protein EAX86_12170 [Candidatus Heimdallarchaeota archaeon]|nr:hypothetical protein [Candidatus Heimdallarchaeota archaeon]